MKNDIVTKNVTNKGVFVFNNVKIRLFRRGINSPSPDGKKTKKSFSWSARFTDPITGIEGNPVSVNSLRKKIGSTDVSPIRTRDEALLICSKAVELGIAFGQNYNPSFISYCSEFWDYEQSRYVRDILLEDPNGISLNYCRNTQKLITTHVKKVIPESRKLQSIKRFDIENLKRKLMEKGELSPETIRKVLKAVSQPMDYAVHQGLIPSNPCNGISIKTSGKTEERGVYSAEQLKTLIQYLREHKSDNVNSYRLWLAVELATRTGMRLGEIRALKAERVIFSNSDIGNSPALIKVSESWASRVGNKTTKGKRSREVPVAHWVGEALVDFSKRSPHKNSSFVFWGEKAGVPAGEHLLRDGLLDVLGKLNMQTDEKGNRLGFHSFRHALNTIVRQEGILNDVELRQIVGHQSEKMSDIYTHETEDAIVASGIKLNKYFDEALEA